MIQNFLNIVNVEKYEFLMMNNSKKISVNIKEYLEFVPAFQHKIVSPDTDKKMTK